MEEWRGERRVESDDLRCCDKRPRRYRTATLKRRHPRADTLSGHDGGRQEVSVWRQEAAFNLVKLLKKRKKFHLGFFINITTINKKSRSMRLDYIRFNFIVYKMSQVQSKEMQLASTHKCLAVYQIQM